MDAIKIKKLTKRFEGVAAIDNLSINFERGKITALIGPNGSGKSTLTNVLTGMLQFEEGTIALHEDITLKYIKPYDTPVYGLTRTFQDVRLFEQMSVTDNVLITLTARNVFSSLFERHSKLHEKQAEEALKIVGLWDKRDAQAGSLSYGQRKLLEIARVLAMSETGRANIILFDEPFAGLFPQMVKSVSKIITDLKTQGRTILLIEHNMELIRELSDRVIVIDSGSLLAEGAPEDVLSKKEVIEAYLGA